MRGREVGHLASLINLKSVVRVRPSQLIYYLTQMKKLFYFCLVVMSFVLSSCGSCTSDNGKDETIKVEKKEISVKELVELCKSDFEAVTDTNPKAMFYESDIVLSSSIASDTEDYTVVKALNVVQSNGWCLRFSHDKDTTVVFKDNTYWLEDRPIDLDEIISLDSAITRVKMANIIKPDSKAVVLRKILGPKPLNTMYIFGQTHTGFIYVDAVTGEVGQLEDSKTFTIKK